MVEVVRCEPSNMDELKDIVNKFAENMDPNLLTLEKGLKSV